MAAPAAADPLTGDFRGTTVTGQGGAVSVVLHLQGQATPGQMAGNIRFGEPRTCTIGLEFSGMDNDWQAYALKKSTGGYCDRIMGGAARLRSAPQALEVEIIQSRSSSSDKFVLQPDNP